MPSTIESYILRVTDLDRSTRFWEEVIGAEVVSRSESDTSTDVVLRSPIGGGSVQLTRIHNDDRPIDLGHSLFRQYMNTSDSAGLYKHAVNLGYDATHDPFDVPGRVNVVKSYTRQPDGYLMDLCEFQGDPGKRILHGQVDPKEHAREGKIATYIGPTAIYVTTMDAAVDFWSRLGASIMDRVEMGDYMEITQMRVGPDGVVIQLMEIKGQRERAEGRGGEQAERTTAVMPKAGKVDLGSGIPGLPGRHGRLPRRVRERRRRRLPFSGSADRGWLRDHRQGARSRRLSRRDPPTALLSTTQRSGSNATVETQRSNSRDGARTLRAIRLTRSALAAHRTRASHDVRCAMNDTPDHVPAVGNLDSYTHDRRRPYGDAHRSSGRAG